MSAAPITHTSFCLHISLHCHRLHVHHEKVSTPENKEEQQLQCAEGRSKTSYVAHFLPNREHKSRFQGGKLDFHICSAALKISPLPSTRRSSAVALRRPRGAGDAEPPSKAVSGFDVNFVLPRCRTPRPGLFTEAPREHSSALAPHSSTQLAVSIQDFLIVCQTTVIHSKLPAHQVCL